MMTGSEPASALAAMMAPRRLQSLGAAVQAEAAAASSVRSTVRVVANTGFRLEGLGAARKTVVCRFDELEDALRVLCRVAPVKNPSVRSAQTTFLFIIMLRPYWLFACCSCRPEWNGW